MNNLGAKMGYKAYDYTEIPKGWTKCVGKNATRKIAERYVELWLKKDDRYYYKILPQFIKRKSTSHIIIRKLKDGN
jgi:hypothetical protein